MNQTALTKFERQACQDFFKTFRKIGSSHINKQELRQILTEMVQKPDEELLMKIIQECDSTGKEQISYEDFQKIIGKYKVEFGMQDDSELRNLYLALGSNYEPNDDMPLPLDCLHKILKENFSLNVELKEMAGGSPNMTQISFQDLKNFLQ